VACLGAKVLAKEIVDFWSSEGKNSSRPVLVILPGGTGTTALLLNREIKAINTSGTEISVAVVPCVGDDSYLRRQMMALDISTGGTGSEKNLPEIIGPNPTCSIQSSKEGAYFVFGKPSRCILETFSEMATYGVPLDLLYGSPTWAILLRYWGLDTLIDCSKLEHDKSFNMIKGKTLMYVHSGGMEGIASQMNRYKREGLI